MPGEIEKEKAKEAAKVLLSLFFLKLQDAGHHTLQWRQVEQEINDLFVTQFGKSDFLARLGIFLVELGLYPERFQLTLEKG